MADAVDFQFVLFLSPVLGSLSLRGSPWPEPVIAEATTFAEGTIRGERREELCSLTVGFLVIGRWDGCRWINPDDILAFAVVPLLTGSTLHHVLSLWARAGALVGSTSFGIVLSPRSLCSLATGFREPASQVFERF